MHDPTKALMGNTLSSAKEITTHDSDPATFVAGLGVSFASTGLLSLLKSDGPRIGISLGRSLSDSKKTSVCRDGEKVPLKLSLKRASGNATITSFANLLTTTPDTIVVGATTFTSQAGASTPGTATFTAATSNNAAAASLAAQINAHAVAGALVLAVASSAVVNLYAKAGGAAGNAIALAYHDLGSATIGATVSGANLSGGSDVVTDVDYVVKGAKAYVNDLTGVGDVASGSTITDAVYVSGVLTGIDESGASVPCALVDMPGGL